MRSLSVKRFDIFCRIARQLFDVAVALVWVNGESIDATAPTMTSMAETLQPKEIVELLPDATVNPLWVSDVREQQATGLPFLRKLPKDVHFFACVRFGPDDQGTLMLLDHRPRKYSGENATQLLDLRDLANQLADLTKAESRTAEREALFRLLAETSTDTIVRGNLAGERLYISPSVRNLLGYEPEELIGKKAIDITHPDDIPHFAQLMTQIHNGTLDIGTVEIRQRHKDGTWVWMEASVRLTHDESTQNANGYVASVRNLTRRKSLESHLERLANYDELTGLPNRTLFTQSFHSMIELAKQDNRCLALLYMDLDDFKQINDRHGHRIGDMVLREAASRFQSLMRNDDVVARLGGDEFAALLLLNPAKIDSLADRLIAAITEPHQIGGIEVCTGLSVGIALFPDHADRPEKLLEMADTAMYQAKAAGKCAYRVYKVA